MKQLTQLYYQHPALFTLVSYWLFSAIVTTMPKPPATSYWGTWLYDALHMLSGSLQKLMDKRMQTMEITKEYSPDGGQVDKTTVQTSVTQSDPKI